MISFFLLKTEPSVYSIDQLQEDRITFWDGVKNALAVKHLKSIRNKDKCFIYHTGKEKQVVGLSVCCKNPYEKDGEISVDIKFQKKFSKTLPLKEIKSNNIFKGFDLIRLPRLSVMPVPDKFAESILAHCNDNR